MPDALLPTGTVTFLMTDVEGSTRLWEDEPESMAEALSRHDHIASEVVVRNGGTLVKTRGEGDSTFSAFGSAAEAIRCALELQRALGAEPWPAGATLRVRMALLTGEAELREGDYFGQAVNRCARLRAIGHGGQTLLSLATEEMVRDSLPAGAGLRDLGPHRLKDLFHPERVFQLCHAELPFDFPPLRSLDALPHNLPAQLTSFVGREEEMAELRALVASARLVTLTGSGGAGKTRLALQVAADMLDEFADGVWLVELGTVEHAEGVTPAVASPLHVRDDSHRPLADALREHLATRKLLLVLDNCEQIVRGCAELCAALTRACPELHVLATSREPLGVAGEATWRVPSLSLPETDGGVDAIASFEGVRLFCDRASLAGGHFELTEANAEAVVRICRRLDGIPLAIELAAARVRALTPSQIAERLDDRFRLLTGGGRTAPPRQQTLRAAVDSSYELLSESEALLFRRLAAFSGSFALDAVESVCTGDGLEGARVLDLLSSLVDRSLVVARERDGEVRYNLLETMRQYALDKLGASRDQDAVRLRHLEWFRGVSERAEAGMEGAEAKAWSDALEREADNVRAALEWSLGAGKAPEVGVRLAAGLRKFWEVGGHLTEGRRFLDSALRVEAEPALRLRILRAAGGLASAQGDYGTAEALHEEALALARAVGDERGTANALNSLGTIARNTGHSERARAFHEEALGVARSARDERAVAESLTELGSLAWGQGDYETTRALYGESLDVLRKLGHRRGMTGPLTNLGAVEYGLGNFAAARAAFGETLQIQRELGDTLGAANSLVNLGLVATAQADLDEGRSVLTEALGVARAAGSKPSVVRCLVNLGSIAHARSELEEARSLFSEAIELSQELGYRQVVATAMNNLGSVVYAQGDFERARALQQESLELSWELGDRRCIAFALDGLACVALEEGDAGLSRALGEQCLGLRRELGDASGAARALAVTGLAALGEGDLEAAREHLEESLEAARGADARYQVVGALRGLGLLRRVAGEPGGAEAALSEALAVGRQLGEKIGIAELLEAMVGLHRDGGRLQAAANLAGAADALRAKVGSPLPPSAATYKADLQAIRAGLDEAAFEAAWSKGRGLSWEEAIDAALGPEPALSARAPEPAPPAQAAEATFRKEGQYWTVVYDGTTSRLRDSKGVAHLALLLARPGRELHVLDMVAAVEGTGTAGVRAPDDVGVGGLGDAGEVLDPEARAAYRRRLADLEQEMEEARAWSDPEREARAREEMDSLVAELSSGVGLGGRSRKASSGAERARWSVSRAVKGAIQKIAEGNPGLGDHLVVTIHTGTFCSYVPDPRAPVAWRL